MTQLVMAYLPIEKLSEAIRACLSADYRMMENAVTYWEFVTPDIAKWQNAYITDELLNILGNRDFSVPYHIIKWDSWHNLFLVLFASAFIPEDVYGVAGRLSPQRKFFEHHISGMLKRMSSQQVIAGRALDANWEFISMTEDRYAGFGEDSESYSRWSQVGAEYSAVINHMWGKNNNIFAWQLELASVVMGMSGSPIYINNGNYLTIFAK